MGKNFKLSVDVNDFSIDKVKNILWQLYCSPEDAFKRLGINEKVDDTKVVEEAIFASYTKPLLFGGETPYVSTFGVDLGIKFPVVRDTVLERCHKAVLEEKHCIEKAIKLLKTQDNGDDTSYRRLVGGLKEIGFNNREANYLVDTVNLYPVALLLERLVNDLSERKAAKQEKAANVTTISGKQQMKQEMAQPDFVSALIENVTDVYSFYSLIGDYKTEEEVMNEYTRLMDELEKMKVLVKVSKTLGQAGLKVDSLIANREEIEDVLSALQALAKAV